MGEEGKEGEGAAADKINDMIENIKRSYDIAIQKWGVGGLCGSRKGGCVFGTLRHVLSHPRAPLLIQAPGVPVTRLGSQLDTGTEHWCGIIL